MNQTQTAGRSHRIRQIILMTVSVLLFAALLLIPSMIRPVGAASQLTDATVKKYEEQLKSLAAQKSALSAKIADAKNAQADAVKNKNFLDQQINLTQQEIETLDSLLEEAETKISATQINIINKKADISEQRKNFLERIRITYEEGRTGYLELLLGAESLYDFLTRVERVGCMMDYNTRMMEKYQADCDTLEAEEDSLEAYLAIQEDSKATRETKKQELQLQLSAAEGQLSSLEASIYQNQTSYSQVASEEAKIDAELEAYLKELQAKQNAAYVGGEFIWPVDISFKRISSPFGWRNLYGVMDNHRGIDIPANAWSNVYASNSGTVIIAQFHWSYGNYVLIDHGGGKATLYAHNNSLTVKVGDKVQQGQVIAKIGTTGNSYGNHCHFEVRINGVCQDPLGYVTQPK